MSGGLQLGLGAMGCTLLVSVFESLPLHASWLQTRENLDNHQKLSCITTNWGTSSEKSLNHVLNLLFNHGQKEQTKHTSRIIHGLERVSAGGLVSQLCVCSCRCADLQHPQKCSLIYGPRAALRGSAGTGSFSRQQTSAEPAAGPCCRRGERGWGPDSFIPLEHPIQKGTNWIFPRVDTVCWIGLGMPWPCFVAPLSGFHCPFLPLWVLNLPATIYWHLIVI